jgi:hypothetical protein
LAGSQINFNKKFGENNNVATPIKVFGLGLISEFFGKFASSISCFSKKIINF